MEVLLPEFFIVFSQLSLNYIESSIQILSIICRQENQYNGALGSYHWILKPETQLRIKTNFNMSLTRLNGKVEQVSNVLIYWDVSTLHKC